MSGLLPSSPHLYGCWREVPRKHGWQPIFVKDGYRIVNRFSDGGFDAVPMFRQYQPAWLPLPCGHDLRHVDTGCVGCCYLDVSP